MGRWAAVGNVAPTTRLGLEKNQELEKHLKGKKVGKLPKVYLTFFCRRRDQEKTPLR